MNIKKRAYTTPIGNEGMYVLDTASWRMERPVIDKTKCSNCGICLSYCPVCAVIRENKEYRITYSYCKGCGICAAECSKGAISMIPEIRETEGGK